MTSNQWCILLLIFVSLGLRTDQIERQRTDSGGGWDMASVPTGVRSAGESARNYGLLRRQDWPGGGGRALWGGLGLLSGSLWEVQYRGDCVMDRVLAVTTGMVDILTLWGDSIVNKVLLYNLIQLSFLQNKTQHDQSITLGLK